MSKLYLHQIYLDFGKGKPSPFSIPEYKKQMKKTIGWCSRWEVVHVMWGVDMHFCDRNIEDLVDEFGGEIAKTYYAFKYPIQRVDFAKYLILYKYGGLYLDCDVAPINGIPYDLMDLWGLDQFFVRWETDKKQLPYNAVMGSGMPFNRLFREIIDHVIESDKIKRKSIPESWVGRFVFHTTGHYMLQRVLKKHPHIKKLNILNVTNTEKGIKSVSKNAMFADCNASAWYS